VPEQTAHPPEPGRRNAALDGLRGLAVVLVVLSHGWVLHSFDDLEQIDPFDGVFRAGSIAVTMFLVVSGFLVTRSMLEAREAGGPGSTFSPLVRRFVRISAQVFLVLFVILVTKQVDRTDGATQDATWTAVVRGASYTLNSYMRDNALTARADVGHLWYLSVEMQFFVVAALVIAVAGARRPRLVITLVALIALVTWWRWHVYDAEGWYSASLRTTTRVDGLLYGALGALVMGRVARWRKEADAVLGAAALVLVGVVASASRLDIEDYFKLQGVVLAAGTTLFVMASQVSSGGTIVEAALAWRPLSALGRASLTVYVWHLPLFWFVSRHTGEWSDPARAALGAVALVVLIVVLERLVEAPVRRWSAGIGRRSRGTVST
jgi:peptidoglycan/LPS O-acetylase OafA/YrhL